MLIKHTIVGLNLLVIGVAGSLTAFIILNVPELAAALAGVAMVGAVLFVVGWEMPEHPIKAMREEIEYLKENVERLLEELGVLDRNPVFIPSTMSTDGKLSIIIPLTKNTELESTGRKIPERMLVTMKNIPCLKLKPPCLKIIDELGVSEVETIGQVEDFISKTLVQHLNIVDGVKVATRTDGTIVVTLSKIKYGFSKYRGKIGFIITIVGAILAETFNRKIEFLNMEKKLEETILFFK